MDAIHQMFESMHQSGPDGDAEDVNWPVETIWNQRLLPGIKLLTGTHLDIVIQVVPGAFFKGSLSSVTLLTGTCLDIVIQVVTSALSSVALLTGTYFQSTCSNEVSLFCSGVACLRTGRTGSVEGPDWQAGSDAGLDSHLHSFINI